MWKKVRCEANSYAEELGRNAILKSFSSVINSTWFLFSSISKSHQNDLILVRYIQAQIAEHFS